MEVGFVVASNYIYAYPKASNEMGIGITRAEQFIFNRIVTLWIVEWINLILTLLSLFLIIIITKDI